MYHTFLSSFGRLRLRPLEESDLETLRKWRNNNNLSKYLSKIGTITKEQQLLWYQKYSLESDSYIWSIIEDARLIGSISIYNIKRGYGEIGKIMIGEAAARGKGYGYFSMVMAMKLGFEYLGIRTFRLSVHEKNIPALKTYQRIGFKITNSHPFDNSGCEYEMSINKKQFNACNQTVLNDITIEKNDGDS